MLSYKNSKSKFSLLEKTNLTVADFLTLNKSVPREVTTPNPEINPREFPETQRRAEVGILTEFKHFFNQNKSNKALIENRVTEIFSQYATSIPFPLYSYTLIDTLLDSLKNVGSQTGILFDLLLSIEAHSESFEKQNNHQQQATCTALTGHINHFLRSHCSLEKNDPLNGMIEAFSHCANLAPELYNAPLTPDGKTIYIPRGSVAFSDTKLLCAHRVDSHLLFIARNPKTNYTGACCMDAATTSNTLIDLINAIPHNTTNDTLDIHIFGMAPQLFHHDGDEQYRKKLLQHCLSAIQKYPSNLQICTFDVGYENYCHNIVFDPRTGTGSPGTAPLGFIPYPPQNYFHDPKTIESLLKNTSIEHLLPTPTLYKGEEEKPFVCTIRAMPPHFLKAHIEAKSTATPDELFKLAYPDDCDKYKGLPPALQHYYQETEKHYLHQFHQELCQIELIFTSAVKKYSSKFPSYTTPLKHVVTQAKPILSQLLSNSESHGVKEYALKNLNYIYLSVRGTAGDFIDIEAQFIDSLVEKLVEDIKIFPKLPDLESKLVPPNLAEYKFQPELAEYTGFPTASLVNVYVASFLIGKFYFQQLQYPNRSLVNIIYREPQILHYLADFSKSELVPFLFQEDKKDQFIHNKFIDSLIKNDFLKFILSTTLRTFLASIEYKMRKKFPNYKETTKKA